MRVLMLVATSLATDTRVLREATTLVAAGHQVHIIGKQVPTDWTPPGYERSPRMSSAVWGFNGDLDHPTFTPSVLNISNWGPERRELRCHSFVTGGRIEFLGDFPHTLAGQTVDLPEIAP